MRKTGIVLSMIAMFAISILVVVFVGKHLDAIYRWTLTIAEFAFGVYILVLALLSLFRKTRTISATGYVIASYTFGANLFLAGVITVLQLWGIAALVIGLLFAGVGVVPVAFLAAIFNRQWDAFWQLVLGLIFTWGTRAYGLHLVAKAERDRETEYAMDAATDEAK